MNSKTKIITITAMLCALAYTAVVVARIPVVLFLSYEPKDVVITLGGLIWGPLTSIVISIIVSALEMVTISETGILGCIMNIISSCAFACTASTIYRKKRTLTGAVIGLTFGVVTMVTVMIAWNYLITPIYMGYPREAIAKLLLPAFLPFNFLKGGLNATITFLLYKPMISALRKTGYVSVSETPVGKKPRGLWILAGLIAAICILFIMSMNGLL